MGIMASRRQAAKKKEKLSKAQEESAAKKLGASAKPQVAEKVSKKVAAAEKMSDGPNKPAKA